MFGTSFLKCATPLRPESRPVVPLPIGQAGSISLTWIIGTVPGSPLTAESPVEPLTEFLVSGVESSLVSGTKHGSTMADKLKALKTKLETHRSDQACPSIHLLFYGISIIQYVVYNI